MKKENYDVKGEDLTFILGGDGHKYTWDEFYSIMEYERSIGNPRCPQASYIALELLKSTLLKLPYKSGRTNSETHLDMIQDAYLIISEKIKDFDPSQSNFKTFIMKWFQGLARETRDDGVTDYQKKKFGFKLYSSDALMTSVDGEGEYSIEFVDETAFIDLEIEKKAKARSNELLHQTIGQNIELEGAEGNQKRKIYCNAACYHKMFGGINELSESMKDAIEDIVAERG